MCQPARELGINAHRYHTDGGSLTDAHRGPAFLSDSVTHWLSDSNCPLSDFYSCPVCSNPQILRDGPPPSLAGRLDHLLRRWIRPTGRSKPGYIEVPSTLTLASFNWIGKILLGVQVIYRALFCWISPTGRCDPGYQVISANLVFLDLEQLAWACLCLSLTPLHLLEVLMDR